MITAIMFFIYWPASYLYFKSLNENFKFKKIYIVYFLPFIYYLITWFSFFIKSGEEKLKFVTASKSGTSNILSRIIAYSFMFLLIFLIIHEYKKVKNKKILTKLFYYFNLVLSFVSIFYYIYFLLIYKFDIKASNIIGFISYQLVFILPIFLVVPVLIMKIIKPNLELTSTPIPIENKNLPNTTPVEPHAQAQTVKHVEAQKLEPYAPPDTEKYQMNRITKGDAKEYLEKIIKVVEEKELYKDNNFNLTKLSKEINIPSAYISQALNIHHGETFYNFINKYRIEVSKKMLKDPKYDNKTILSIAYESGFNSKATFNNFFKKNLGMTPSKYRKMKTDNKITD